MQPLILGTRYEHDISMFSLILLFKIPIPFFILIIRSQHERFPTISKLSDVIKFDDIFLYIKIAL